MTIALAGISHKTAPVEVRELLAFTNEACADGLRTLVDGEVVREGLIISTCNRVEVLAVLNPERREEGAARVSRFLSDVRTIPQEVFNQHLYTHANMEAVRHLFRVASSLDSMVIGEPQILGQVRRAYTLAVETGTAGRVLHRLMHQAFHTAKRVRSETNIATSAVSVSYVAVELGRKIFGALENCTVMLIGAGEMAELAARHLKSAGAARLLFANRTDATARGLAAEFDGEAVPYTDFATRLAEADIIICSTGAPDYILDSEMAQRALEARRHRPIFFIDISVPRNIDPRVGEISNLFLFDVDDLAAVVASNLREREMEADRAQEIIEAEAARFEQSLVDLEIGPKIGALRKEFQDLARKELQRQRSRLGDLTPEQEQAIEALLVSTVNKISHPVMMEMRRSFEAVEHEFANVWRQGSQPQREEASFARQVLEPVLIES
jgi:glutamyl-tRNA reductase